MLIFPHLTLIMTPTFSYLSYQQCHYPFSSESMYNYPVNLEASPSQQLLLQWYFRFGHKNFYCVRNLLRFIYFVGDKYTYASLYTQIDCDIFRYKNSHRTLRNYSTYTTNTDTIGPIKGKYIHASDRFLVDHFESSLKGKT